jgi:molybdate transport repressor ModE-like protein
MNRPDSWLGVELRHLAALEAVGRSSSFGAAARELGYTQSAVSQQIAQLERLVGQKLVDRPGGPKRVSLTEAGRLLLRHADAIVAQLDAAQADMAALAQGEGGPLRVGIYQSVGVHLLPALLRRFSEEWPRVELHLEHSAADDEPLRALERGELDLTFADLPLPEGPFEAVEILRDRYVLVVAADSELARRGRAPTPREFADLDLVGFRSCRSLQGLADALPHPPKFVFRSDDNSTVQSLAAAGIGAAPMPRLTVNADDPSVVLLPLGSRFPPRRVGVAWHRDRYRSPAAEAFVDAAIQVADSLGEPAFEQRAIA